ncbi:MAG TPA: transposase [Acidimicrobiales bacterium]|nr:transposase [Acidimicrobiales bacterium]
MLVNARHVKNLPGRKTDVSDAAWLAQLGAHGLVRSSFVAPEPIRQLRDLTRIGTTIVRERTREIQRLEKLMEDTRGEALLGRHAHARRLGSQHARRPRGR